MADTKFSCDYGKRKSNCKKCKKPIEKGNPRIAKIVPNFFDDGQGVMKQYHHISCIFEMFSRARATTKKIEDVSDLEGFADMNSEDKQEIKDQIANLNKTQDSKKGSKNTTPKKKLPDKSSKSNDVKPKKSPPKSSEPSTSKGVATKSAVLINSNSKDNLFREFRRLCGKIAEEASYNEKTNILKHFLKHGSSGDGFTGDIHTLLRLLLPGSIKRIYNLQSKQLVKLFSQIFGQDIDDMVEDLEQGDVSETVFKFFESSDCCPPLKKSILTIQEVDKFLQNLSALTREEDQMNLLEKIAKKCTGNDLKTIIRLIKSDLKIVAGAKHILDALDPNAHEAFKASRDLEDVINRVQENQRSGGSKSLEIRAALMTPVAPMLAEACKSVEQAMKKCPNGMYSEIKYDGERVQLHMKDGQFHFYSRSLKPVQSHKVAHFDKYIPQAFPKGDSMILDSEVLMIDTNTGNPLPFGTLGIHKKSQFQNANVCLFIFDILHFNGENLMKMPIEKRRRILEKNIVEIPNRILLSEMQFVNDPNDLKQMIAKVIKDGLEGLVLKDIGGIYEPGKRHWLKVKKDYLLQGKMADTADLVVLGAYYGTGNKGGLMSVFLMGVYDENTKQWCTVTKVGNGHDDKTLDKINKELKTVKISKDFEKVPKWLNVNRTYVPDLIVEDPKSAPVWEITGTEFSKSEAHTANGISIRFPRVTKIRDDKSWETATSLRRLELLFEKSKEESDVSLLLGVKTDPGLTSSSPKKRPSGSKESGDATPTKVSKKHYLSQSSADFLHDVFSGVKIHVPDGVKKSKLMRRHVVAYNGDIVADFQLDNATHVVECDTLGKADVPSTAKLVSVEHVWECIKKKKML